MTENFKVLEYWAVIQIAIRLIANWTIAMRQLKDLVSIFSKPNALKRAVESARDRMVRAAEGGRTLEGTTIDPIINAVEKYKSGSLSAEDEKQFYIAYGNLNKQTADISRKYFDISDHPFEDAVSGAEQLLKYGSEAGVTVSADIVEAIIKSRNSLNENNLDGETRAKFYESYSKLASIFGNVTAETIQAGRSKGTRRHLKRRRYFALIVTFVVALLSVVTFMADATSKKIAEQTKEASDLSIKLNDSLFADKADSAIDRKYFTEDACGYTGEISKFDDEKEKSVRTVQNVRFLQQFAGLTRDIHSNGIKLNNFVKSLPFAYK